jgi:tRNA-modifying protein YgfZ
MIPGRDNPGMHNATLSPFPPLRVVLNRADPLGNPPSTGPLGIIRATGADTVKFLQGQLTQDVALLGLSEARLAAWCSAKGRMLASFIVFKITHEDIVLICSSSVLPTTLKRLQMFVLRAQCKLSDATSAFVLHGLAGDTPPEGLQYATNSGAAYASSVWALTRYDTEITVQLPPGHVAGQSVPRALRLQPVEQVTQTTTAEQAPADASHAQALARWQYLEVSCGIAPITAAVSDLYVPQMLNYESVGGVNFKKGCYPGQEVVARSQFRGTLKRRAFIVTSPAALVAGQEVFDSRDTEQPCGTVAYAAVYPDQGESEQALGFAAIVSMQTSAADSPRLYAAAGADGVQPEATLHLQALPYPLLADI